MAENKSIQIQVYEELKSNIMELRLFPGQVMSTQEMATRMNVSRTPVREAFLHLQSEGLVEMIPQRQTRVSKISIERVGQEKFIRECLEVGVISEFLKTKKREAILEMSEMIALQKRCMREKKPAGFVDADDCFHKVLFICAGQYMAWKTIQSTQGHYNRFRVLLVKKDEILRSSIRQHERIVKLLEDGDEDAVRNELVSHFRRVDIQEVGLTEEYPDYFETGSETRKENVITAL